MVSITTTLARRSFLWTKNLGVLSTFTYTTDSSTNLKDVLAKKISEHNKKVASFRKEHDNTEIQKITIDMMYGGMRGIKGLVTETSSLDPEEGIRLRGYSVQECQKLLPKATKDGEPIPEGIWWLLLTGDIPTKKQTAAITKEWNDRAGLPAHVGQLLDNLPSELHPMSQFIAAIAALQSESQFAKAYSRGVPKSTYWQYAYEDAMNLLARLPAVAAKIYRNLYRGGSSIGSIDEKKDWSGNFAAMLGFENSSFVELLRLYLAIHSDHEGGNVSAHTSHLVGSALSDAYLSFAAAMAGLAGPRHGLASQEVLVFLDKIVDEVGGDIKDKNKLREWLWNHLKSGQVIPGYGHAVLRKTDPRYTCLREFALKHLPQDPRFKLVSDLYEITPNLLLEQGKAKNPWPNVDAHSGVLLQHYGMKEMSFITVLFGVSRALGCLAQLIWARGMGLPIERPKSHTTEGLMKLITASKDNENFWLHFGP